MKIVIDFDFDFVFSLYRNFVKFDKMSISWENFEGVVRFYKVLIRSVDFVDVYKISGFLFFEIELCEKKKKKKDGKESNLF